MNRDIIYFVFFYYYQIFYFIKYYYFFYMIKHYTLYIEQEFNKSVSNLSLNYFHQTLFAHIFPSHDLYIYIYIYINMVSDLNCLPHFLISF